jgi:hypothetical protein
LNGIIEFAYTRRERRTAEQALVSGTIDHVAAGSAPRPAAFDYLGPVHRLREATLGAPKAA